MAKIDMLDLPFKMKKLLSKQSKVFAEAATEKASELLGKRMDMGIANYYNSYSPIYYDRTYNLQKNAWKKYITKSGKVLRGGIKLYSRMEKYENAGLNTPTIFYRSVWKGQHGQEGVGNKKKFKTDEKTGKYIIDEKTGKPAYTIVRETYKPIVTYPSPYDYVVKYLTSRTFQSKVVNYALSQVKNVHL